MTESRPVFHEGSDLDQRIAGWLSAGPEGDSPSGPASLQALAVLIDAEMSETERAEAFAAVMVDLLRLLSPTELERFTNIAQMAGEHAALAYLTQVITPPDGVTPEVRS